MSVEIIRAADEQAIKRRDPASPPRQMLEAALELALVHGFAVFPCNPANKVPLTAHGFKDGTTDTDQILQSWTDRPDAMIGAATGNVSGFWVLDVDDKHGKEGSKRLAELEAKHGQLPPTVCQRTPSGGKHLLFRMPDRRVRSLTNVGGLEGLDTRGDGGFIVIAPSVMCDGSAYSFTTPLGMPIAEAPGWLLELIGQASNHGDGSKIGEGDVAPGFQDGFDTTTISSRDDAPPWFKRVASALWAIENVDMDRGTWISVSHAVKQAVAGDEAFYSLVIKPWNERYARRSRGMEYDRQHGWDSISNSDVGWRVLKARAIDHGWKDPDPSAEAQAEFAETPERETTVSVAPVAEADHARSEGMAPGEKYDPFKRLRVIRGSEMEIDTEPRWLIYGVLDRSTLAVMYGDSGSGKTFTAVDMACRIAEGMEWFSHEVEQGAALYVAAEAPESVKRRIVAWRKHHRRQAEQVWEVCYPVNFLDQPKDIDDLIRVVDTLQREHGVKFKMIVIDTLSRALAGGNENGPEAMGTFTRNCERLRMVTDATVLIVHHSGKNEARGMRGHSSLRAALDTGMEVKDSSIACDKERDAEQFEPIGFQIVSIALGHDARGKPINSAVIERGGAKRAMLMGERLTILDALSKACKSAGAAVPHSVWLKAYLAIAGVAKGQAKNRLDRSAKFLEKEGWIIKHDERRPLYEPVTPAEEEFQDHPA